MLRDLDLQGEKSVKMAHRISYVPYLVSSIIFKYFIEM